LSESKRTAGAEVPLLLASRAWPPPLSLKPLLPHVLYGLPDRDLEERWATGA
jgi:hypothetical protein